MSEILQLPSGYLSPVGDYSRHNTQALGGVSHLWSDFFARALACLLYTSDAADE